MPPKEKVSKAMIQDAAFEMTKEYGFEAVTARKLAEKLNCSTQPIFRAYENMNELRIDLFYMSSQYFAEYMLNKKSRSQPAYLTMGMAYIELALKEKNLFSLVASVDDFGGDPLGDAVLGENSNKIFEKLPEAEKLSQKDRTKLVTMVSAFTHGIASLLASGRVSLTEKEQKEYITRAYESFRDGIAKEKN